MQITPCYLADGQAMLWSMTFVYVQGGTLPIGKVFSYFVYAAEPGVGGCYWFRAHKDENLRQRVRFHG